MARQTKEKKKELRKERNPLKRAVTSLQDARRELSEASSSLEIKEELFNKQNRALIERRDAAKLAVEMNDNTLRELLIQMHEKTQDTTFGPGLDIRIRTALQVHDDYALRQWAFENMPIALEVNLSIIKLAVEGLPGKVRGAFMVEVPTPYIAKDLSKAVEAL